MQQRANKSNAMIGTHGPRKLAFLQERDRFIFTVSDIKPT